MSPGFTKNELRKFDRLTLELSNPNQLARIKARFAVRRFEEEHGAEKCAAMFEALKKRDAK